MVLAFGAGLVCLGVAIPVYPTLSGVTAAVVIAVMALSGLTVVVVEPGARSYLFRWALVSFALHAVVGAAIVHVPDLVSYLGPDAWGYHEAARSGGSLRADKSGFVTLLGAFYRVTSPSMIVGALMNAAFAAGLVPVVARTTGLLFGDRAARMAAPLVTLLPPLLIWPSQVLREAPILFLLAVMTLAAAHLHRRTTLSSVVTLLSASLVLLTFRGFTIPIAAALVGSVLFAQRQVIVGLARVSAVAILAITSVGVLGLGLSGYRAAAERGLDDLDFVRRNTSIEATTGFDDTTVTRTNAEALAYLRTAMPRLLAGPAPWEVSGPRELPAIADAFVWWWCLWHVVVGLRAAKALGSRRRLLVLLLPASVMAIILALGLGNYGILIRQRPQVLVFLLPIIASSLARRRSGRVDVGSAPEVVTAVH